MIWAALWAEYTYIRDLLMNKGLLMRDLLILKRENQIQPLAKISIWQVHTFKQPAGRNLRIQEDERTRFQTGEAYTININTEMNYYRLR
jgi:hypothetical protein